MYNSLRIAFEQVKWERIHAYMIISSWKWRGEVPSIDDMKLTVESLMSEVARSERKNTSCSTGGFFVNKWTWDSGTEYEIGFDIT